MSKNQRFGVALAIMLFVAAVLVWLISSRAEPTPPRPEPPSPEEARVKFVVDQLERICLSSLRREARDSVLADLAIRITRIGSQATAAQVEEVSRGARQDLPAPDQLKEGDAIRDCISTNFPIILAAASPAAPAPPPESQSRDNGAVLPTCKQLSPLRSLGYSGGHKTKFCYARGFEGVTNFPNSGYKDHGGGFCYSGDEQECLKQAVLIR